ncbi:MAG: 2-keto-4-pentenoate hydratase [Rhodomicrobium sp.]
MTSAPDGLSLQDAYSVTASIRALRERRGVRVVGRKIGFTNRAIWQQYNVYAPVWGYMYDTTVHDYRDDAASARVPWEFEPRIEPEIVFGLAHTPSSGMDERALLDCVDWVAQGFEIVASMFRGWTFSAPDTVAGFGLHAALFVGPKQRPRSDPERWLGSLANFQIELRCNDEPVDRGHARNVLDGPLHALRHLAGMLQTDGSNAPLGAGEIVTTGTLTRAMPVSRGERWSAVLSGIALEGIGIDFA